MLILCPTTSLLSSSSASKVKSLDKVGLGGGGTERAADSNWKKKRNSLK